MSKEINDLILGTTTKKILIFTQINSNGKINELLGSDD